MTSEGVIKIQVQARGNSPAMATRQRLESPAAAPSPIQHARVIATSSSRETSAQRHTADFSEVKYRTTSGRRSTGERNSYINAVSSFDESHVTGGGGGGEQSMARRTLSGLPLMPASTLSSPSPLPLSLKRKCLLAASIKLTHGNQTEDRYCFLCSDKFFIAKQKSRSGLRLKQQVPLSEMWVWPDIEGVPRPMTGVEPSLSIIIGWPMTNLIATFSSSKHRHAWLSKLERQINAAKNSMVVQSTMVRVHTADKQALPQFIDLSVSIQEDANSVLARSCSLWAQQSSDMKLWLQSSGRFFPLLGHECPMAIKLSFQKVLSRPGRGDQAREGAARDSNDHDDLLNCRFVLRSARKPPEQHHHTGEPNALQKLLKHSLQTIKLRRDHKNKMAANTLFGRNLADVCQDGHLPRPLMAILEQLFREGLAITGILRKAANKRRVTEVRERIDAGDDVTIESAVVAGDLLKEYLRSLPECLLTSGLYDSWLDIMALEDDTARIAKIKKLYASLPACNQLLLAHIFCILHHMAQHCDVNKMTSHNLGVCISFSLLWSASTDITPEDSVRSASLVTFLIEHTTAIFGDDVIHLLGQPPVVDKQPVDEPVTPDTGHEKLSMLSEDSLDSPITGAHLPHHADSGCCSSSVDGDSSEALPSLSMSITDMTSQPSSNFTPRSRSMDDDKLDVEQHDGQSDTKVAGDTMTSLAACSSRNVKLVTGSSNGTDSAFGSQEQEEEEEAVVNDNTYYLQPANHSESHHLVDSGKSISKSKTSPEAPVQTKISPVSTVANKGTSTIKSDSRLLSRVHSQKESQTAEGGRPSLLATAGTARVPRLKNVRWSAFDEHDNSPEEAVDVLEDYHEHTNNATKSNSITVAPEIKFDKHVKDQTLSVAHAEDDDVDNSATDDVYHVHGILSAKGSGLHNIAAIMKADNLQQQQPVQTASQPIVDHHHRLRQAASNAHNRSSQHRFMPLPPPYQEAVWRAKHLRRGINPEEAGHVSVDRIKDNRSKGGHYDNQNGFDERSQDDLQLQGSAHHGPFYGDQLNRRMASSLYSTNDTYNRPQSHTGVGEHGSVVREKKRYSHHQQSARVSDSGKTRSSRTPQPHTHQHLQDDRRKTVTPTYPEGYWVTRLEHTADSSEEKSVENGHGLDFETYTAGDRALDHGLRERSMNSGAYSVRRGQTRHFHDSHLPLPQRF